MNKFNSELNRIQNEDLSDDSLELNTGTISAKNSTASLQQIIKGKSFYETDLSKKYLDCDYTVFGDECCNDFTNQSNMKIFRQLNSTTDNTILKNFACEICNKDCRKVYLCSFCGIHVCKYHLVKERRDPSEQTENFYKICLKCENNYIRMRFLSIFAGHYSKKKEIIDNQINKVSTSEQKIDNLDRKIIDVKKELITITSDNTVGILFEECTEKKLELQAYTNDLKNLTQMEEYCDKKLVSFRNSSNKIIKEIEETKERFNETKKEKSDLDNEIENLLKEIKKAHANSLLYGISTSDTNMKVNNSDISSSVQKSRNGNNIMQEHIRKTFDLKNSPEESQDFISTKAPRKTIKDKPLTKQKKCFFGMC